MSYGFIGTRCTRNFEKVLSLRWGNERPLGITHVVLFILEQCSINIFSVVYSMACEYC